VVVIATDEGIDFDQLVEARSHAADLVIIGFTTERVERRGKELFDRFPGARDVLFVSAEETIAID
jgi:hypothetical protein